MSNGIRQRSGVFILLGGHLRFAGAPSSPGPQPPCRQPSRRLPRPPVLSPFQRRFEQSSPSSGCLAASSSIPVTSAAACAAGNRSVQILHDLEPDHQSVTQRQADQKGEDPQYAWIPCSRSWSLIESTGWLTVPSRLSSRPFKNQGDLLVFRLLGYSRRINAFLGSALSKAPAPGVFRGQIEPLRKSADPPILKAYAAPPGQAHDFCHRLQSPRN